ncbi:uncharacterized protein LOC127253592 [Andrographis paniculata]|uniref:uncharacterized protein LOC127253592 n=1 Tax=Andrographis paniculata TaxID=175694 RepID=UPI0021E92837|nr:uncharacterized protein LOC127253592 [Andrographis paniculata]
MASLSLQDGAPLKDAVTEGEVAVKEPQVGAPPTLPEDPVLTLDVEEDEDEDEEEYGVEAPQYELGKVENLEQEEDEKDLDLDLEPEEYSSPFVERSDQDATAPPFRWGAGEDDAAAAAFDDDDDGDDLIN